MNRREFSAGAACVAAGAYLGMPGLAWAQSPPPADGKDYISYTPRVYTPAAGKIEVIEFFWYSCPHCNAFEPALEAWSKKLPADVVLTRVPAAFRDDMVPQQRLYYTLEAMGKLGDMHRKVFQAIHVDKQSLDREPGIAAWADRQGLDKVKFQEMYNSMGIQAKARRASQLSSGFKIGGVPSIGVNGKYYTDGDLAGNQTRMLQVTEFLIAESRKAR